MTSHALETRVTPPEPETRVVSHSLEPRGIRFQLGRLVDFIRGAGPEYPVVLALIALGVAAPILIRLSAAHAQSDIPVHAALAAEMVRNGGWLSYTLWYPLIYFTSSGSSDPALLRELSVIFLLIAVMVRTVLVFYVSWAATRSRAVSGIIAMLMLVAMPLLNPARPEDIYLGQITPNVWHNSTQIFALPFSLAAFVAAAALLRAQTMPRALLFGGLVLASTLAKPNYTIALLPVVGLMLLWKMFRARTGLLRQLLLVAAGFVPTALLLVDQYFLVFGAAGVRKATMTFAPLAVWSFFSLNVPVSIALSIAGPLAVLLVLPRKLRSDPALQLSWLVLVVSLLQLGLLAERFTDGTLSMEGNFFWGSYSAVFMVFVASAISLAKAYTAGPLSLGRRMAYLAAVVLLALHAGTGFYYLGRAGVSGFPVFSYQPASSYQTVSPHK